MNDIIKAVAKHIKNEWDTEELGKFFYEVKRFLEAAKSQGYAVVKVDRGINSTINHLFGELPTDKQCDEVMIALHWAYSFGMAEGKHAGKEQQRSGDEAKLKLYCTKFFYWWWNQKGSNTDQGFDEWTNTEEYAQLREVFKKEKGKNAN